MWPVISSAEYELAHKLAEQLIDNCKNMDECVSKMNRLLTVLFHEKKVGDLSNAFASSDKFITNNFIAQLSYCLSEKFGLNNDDGVVLTSNILAEDMVRMSLVEWLSIHTNIPKNIIFNYVWKRDSDEATSYKSELISKIEAIRWYDPCVGGGAFPLSIVSVLRTLGIEHPKIYGCDVNPFYVEATRIRLAIMYSGNFEENYAKVVDKIRLGDALDRFLPQRTIFKIELEEESYDIVIANPPYVKAGKIEKAAKSRYKNNYPEITNQQADLYIYFIAHGFNALSSKGVLTYVSPAQFQNSNYGLSIREVIKNTGGVCAVADFNELPVFKNISVHTSVYTLAKGYVPALFTRFEYDELPEKTPLMKLYVDGKGLKQENATKTGWSFSSSNAHEALKHIENIGVKLKDCETQVYSGVKTGCKPAFFMKEKDIEGFLDYDIKFIKKMLIPKRIRRWKSNWEQEYLVLIKKNEILDENSLIFRHMSLHREKLSSRSDVMGHSTWYGLRECNYYEKLYGSKIIYPDIATECRFSMDLEGIMIPDGAFFLPREDYYLLGILNSCVGRYYFREKCARIGNPSKGGRIRFKKVYVENFPVVDRNSNCKLSLIIESIAKKATDGIATVEDMRLLDETAIQLYQVPSHLLKVFEEA
jgi:hypothetical protein